MPEKKTKKKKELKKEQETLEKEMEKQVDEPAMNDVIKDNIVDKTTEEEPEDKVVDTNIDELEKEIKETMEVVSKLEDTCKNALDEDALKELDEVIDKFYKKIKEEDEAPEEEDEELEEPKEEEVKEEELEEPKEEEPETDEEEPEVEAPEEEIPAEVPDVVEEVPEEEPEEETPTEEPEKVDDEEEPEEEAPVEESEKVDDEDIEVVATGDDEIEVNTGDEDKTQVVVTIDMPADVDPDDVEAVVDVADEEPAEEPVEEPAEEPAEEEVEEPAEEEKEIEEPEEPEDDELSECLENFIKGDSKKQDIIESICKTLFDEKPLKKDLVEALDKYVDGWLNKGEETDDITHIIESFVNYLDSMPGETEELKKAKEKVEDLFKDPEAKKEVKEEEEPEEKEDEAPKEEEEKVETKEGFVPLPIADNATWSAIRANKRVLEHVVKEDTTIDYVALKQAYLYVEEGCENDVDAYQYQIADVINGKLYAIPTAIRKMSELFANDMTLKSLRVKENVIKEVRAKLEKYLEAMGEEIPWSNDPDGGTLRFQESNGLLSIYTAYNQFDPSTIISKLQESENK